ncbi:Phosphomevalonate kinase [Komagataella phaffii CBS 7435]|uniref:Phosphomevalonate kinase n=2 Tax=Komagataella phaffii TaxID=460519 RepID=C4R264_KOMPG|nr:Phosphomevalonate kinase, an essential cytosolic enzyme [Komagataella phaffii GS115]AOA63035.1 GQ67_01009T0 [Komagataella phaffii]CAH2447863.1 Phosphomevalonate kinase [Komagataella phaffii CBS 7435]AOA67421.1 GQ68_00380T0 [Komagataella phaffii GS115]CAY69588.1 Phosphomevalonate kinase, an essential cytosolic enzyme [Komagataella phaffii GS115]CCA38032.1 Phosphomevalonate kinase [Komagataella phaffii CBS 7435]
MKAFSAPSKALLAGGYLVLDANYSSFVIALSARMGATIDSDSTGPTNTIFVQSPQFEGKWSYTYKDGVLSSLGKRNPFIESTMEAVFAFLSPSTFHCINITIYSDPEYHSQEDTVVRFSRNGRKFLFHEKDISKVPKTGLGSSAGLVTVLTTALLAEFSKIDLESMTDLKTIHNLAQIAHCKAQGKIGSGFDVASATFGSIVYRRFDPMLIDGVAFEQHQIKDVVLQDWRMVAEKCALPGGIKLLMGDVMGGSETPKLVSKVLQWRRDKPEESYELWKKLDEANMSLIESLNQLATSSNYTDLLHFMSLHSANSITKLNNNSRNFLESKPLLNVINSFQHIRKQLRIMGEKTGADIEPPSQTQLLNECSDIPGVFGGVVPGAGGFDAICLLVVRSAIDDIIQTTKKNPAFDSVTWLDLEEESEGVQEENVQSYLFAE